MRTQFSTSGATGWCGSEYTCLVWRICRRAITVYMSVSTFFLGGHCVFRAGLSASLLFVRLRRSCGDQSAKTSSALSGSW